MQTADFGVFIDFMSMFQPDDRTGFTYSVPTQQTSFGRALRNIGLLYGHRGSSVFKMTKTPLPPEGDPQRVYEKRGWTHLERRLGDLEAPASNSLNVAAWAMAVTARLQEDDRRTVTANQATAAQRAAAAARVGGGARRAGRPLSRRKTKHAEHSDSRRARGPCEPEALRGGARRRRSSASTPIAKRVQGCTAASPSRCSRTWRS